MAATHFPGPAQAKPPSVPPQLTHALNRFLNGSEPPPHTGLYALPPALRRPPSARPQHRQTVCIITCHNYGAYLAECVDSCLRQTVPFEEVLVVDDASDDDTPYVAARFESRGVKYLRVDVRDVAQARRAGLAALPRTPFVLFVDADNILPASWHADLLAGFTSEEIGVTYGNLMRFNNAGQQLGLVASVRPYHYQDLRFENCADTCSLIRRDAYDQAGGWQPNSYGLHDWALWLDITAHGWKLQMVPGTPLLYRVHTDAMSMARHGRYECVIEISQFHMHTAIVTLFSGREWALPMYGRWLGGLRWNKERLHVVAVDNSGSRTFNKLLRQTLEETGVRHTILERPTAAVAGIAANHLADTAPHRINHAQAMNAHIAALYAEARQHIPSCADWVWCVEDDVEPPADALANLCIGLHRDKRAGLVTGCLRSRFENRLIAWHSADGAAVPVTTPPPPGTFIPLQATGFHSTLIRRPVFDLIAFRAGRPEEGRPYYDWAAARDLRRQGWYWMLAGSVRCRHWTEKGPLDV